MRISRRLLEELGRLQGAMQELASQRNQALRIFVASRGCTTIRAQREFWLEFTWADQEYRMAVHRLAQFCRQQTAAAARRGVRGPASA